MNFKDSNIRLHKLRDILGYRDIRSVIDWCTENGVYILHQGNHKVVNTSEFILSYYKPFIKHLKKKHKNWKECFINYLEGNINKLIPESVTINLEPNIQQIPSQQFEMNDYKLSSQTKDTSFLNMLKNL